MGLSGLLTDGQKALPPHFPKICHIYLIMMKLGTVIPYLKKIQKIYGSRGTPLEFCLHLHFFIEKSTIFAISRNIYRLHFDL